MTLPPLESRTPEPVSVKRMIPPAPTSRPLARTTTTDGLTLRKRSSRFWATMLLRTLAVPPLWRKKTPPPPPPAPQVAETPPDAIIDAKVELQAKYGSTQWARIGTYPIARQLLTK